MCGRNMSKETSSTIGEQKKFNYALKPMSKDEFVRMITLDLPQAPAYFSRDAEINRTGAASLEEIARPAALSPLEVHHLSKEDAECDHVRHIVLDVRSAAEFGAGHVPGSINIGLGGQFAIWAGCLVPMTTPIVIVAGSSEKVDEAVMRLARVGIESARGYLNGGMDAWNKLELEQSTVSQISVAELNDLIQREGDLQILDVRRPPEYGSGHVPRAIAGPLSNLKEAIATLPLDPAKPTAVICAGGYRSSAATSILQQHGFSNLLNVTGGTGAWIDAGYPAETATVNRESQIVNR